MGKREAKRTDVAPSGVSCKILTVLETVLNHFSCCDTLWEDIQGGVHLSMPMDIYQYPASKDARLHECC